MNKQIFTISAVVIGVVLLTWIALSLDTIAKQQVKANEDLFPDENGDNDDSSLKQKKAQNKIGFVIPSNA